jgi:hypothetical protein
MENTEEGIRAELIAKCVKMIEAMYWDVNDAKNEDDEVLRDGYNMACDDIIFAIKHRLPKE